MVVATAAIGGPVAAARPVATSRADRLPAGTFRHGSRAGVEGGCPAVPQSRGVETPRSTQEIPPGLRRQRQLRRVRPGLSHRPGMLCRRLRRHRDRRRELRGLRARLRWPAELRRRSVRDVLPPGRTDYAGICVNSGDDNANCGTCGNRCPPEELCGDGECCILVDKLCSPTDDRCCGASFCKAVGGQHLCCRRPDTTSAFACTVGGPCARCCSGQCGSDGFCA